MARMIKARKRRKSRGKAAQVKTVTRKIYVGAKRKARKFKRAAGVKVTKKDVILSVAGAGVGAIGSAVVLQKLPATLPAVAKNGIVAAAGGVLAYYGVKKRNMALTGFGTGMAAVGAKGLIGAAVPTLAGPRFNVLSAPIARVPRLNAPYIKTNTMAAPFVKTAAAAAFADEESI